MQPFAIINMPHLCTEIIFFVCQTAQASLYQLVDVINIVQTGVIVGNMTLYTQITNPGIIQKYVKGLLIGWTNHSCLLHRMQSVLTFANFSFMLACWALNSSQDTGESQSQVEIAFGQQQNILSSLIDLTNEKFWHTSHLSTLSLHNTLNHSFSPGSHSQWSVLAIISFYFLRSGSHMMYSPIEPSSLLEPAYSF